MITAKKLQPKFVTPKELTPSPIGLHDIRDGLVLDFDFNENGNIAIDQNNNIHTGLSGKIKIVDGKFTDDNGSFKFVGVNTYDLIQSERTQSELESYFDYCLKDGIYVVRAWCFNRTVPATNTAGNFRYLDGTTLTWREQTFKQLDLVLSIAKEKGVKLILPLVDQWNKNKGDYCNWSNAIYSTSYSDDPGDDFHTDENIKQMFKDFIDKLVNRTNTVNGQSYATDDTIFAWELGNELRYTTDPDDNWGTVNSTKLNKLKDWADEMSTYIKSVDSNHLVAFGGASQFYDYVQNDPIHNGTYYGVDYEVFGKLDNIDYFDFHMYAWEDNPDFSLRDYGQANGKNGGYAGWLAQIREYINKAKDNGKPCLLGEWGVDKRNETITPSEIPAYPRDENFKKLSSVFLNGDNGDGILMWMYTNFWDDNNYNIKPNGKHTGDNDPGNENTDDTSLRQQIYRHKRLYLLKNNGTITGATRTQGLGDLRGIKGDGVDDRITFGKLGIFDGTKEFSLVSVFKINNFPDTIARLMNLMGENRLLFTLGDNVDTNVLHIRLDQGGWRNGVETPALELNKFYYVVVTYSPVTGWKMHLNNEYVDTDTTIGNIATSTNTSNAILADDNGANAFNGVISVNRIYNKALSAQEVRNMYLHIKKQAGLI